MLSLKQVIVIHCQHLDSQDKYVMRKPHVKTVCFLTVLTASHHALPADGEVMRVSTFSLFF